MLLADLTDLLFLSLDPSMTFPAGYCKIHAELVWTVLFVALPRTLADGFDASSSGCLHLRSFLEEAFDEVNFIATLLAGAYGFMLAMCAIQI